MFRRIVYRVGHRGAFLLFLALLDLLYGYSILSSPSALNGYHLLLDTQTWGCLWVAVGLVLLTGTAARHDKVHFGIAAALKGAWATAFVNVLLTQDFPRAWVSVVIWASFAALVVVVSSWPEHRFNPAGNNGGKHE